MGMVPRFSPSLSAPLCPSWAPIDPRSSGTSFVLIPGLPHTSIDTAVMGFRGRMPFSTRNVREAGTAQLPAGITHEIPFVLAQQKGSQ
jgi:hypothetical protein